MQLTTKARYAVMAMVDIALCNKEAGEVKAVSLADIASRQKITVAYLEQIFSKLKKASLVKSVRGPGGGYILSKSPSEINAAEIIDAVDEAIKIKGCSDHSQGKGCLSNKAKCITHDLWDGLGNNIRSYLASASLEDVINREISKKEDNPNLIELVAIK